MLLPATNAPNFLLTQSTKVCCYFISNINLLCFFLFSRCICIYHQHIFNPLMSNVYCLQEYCGQRYKLSLYVSFFFVFFCVFPFLFLLVFTYCTTFTLSDKCLRASVFLFDNREGHLKSQLVIVTYVKVAAHHHSRIPVFIRDGHASARCHRYSNFSRINNLFIRKLTLSNGKRRNKKITSFYLSRSLFSFFLFSHAQRVFG